VESVFWLVQTSSDGSRVFTSNFGNSFSATPVSGGSSQSCVRGVACQIYSQSFSSGARYVLGYSWVRDASGKTTQIEGLPAYKYHSSAKWVSDDLALIQRSLAPTAADPSPGNYAYLWSVSRKALAGCLQGKGKSITAAAADPSGKTIYFSRSIPYGEEPQPAKITCAEIASGRILEELLLEKMSAGPGCDDAPILDRVYKSRGLDRLWYWPSRGLLVGIADPPPKDYSHPKTAFLLDPAGKQLSHLIELTGVQYSGFGVDFNEAVGWLAVACGSKLRWYDLAARKEAGSLELPARSGRDTCGCVAIRPAGSLIAVGGGSRLGAVFRTDTGARLLLTTFDSSVDDVAFGVDGVSFLLHRGEIVSYRNL
jgi:hypothetical protein